MDSTQRLWSLKAKCELRLANSSINGHASPLHLQTAAVAVNRNRNLTHSHSLTHTLTVYWLTKPDRSHWNVSASGHLATLSGHCDACLSLAPYDREWCLPCRRCKLYRPIYYILTKCHRSPLCLPTKQLRGRSHAAFTRLLEVC